MCWRGRTLFPAPLCLQLPPPPPAPASLLPLFGRGWDRGCERGGLLPLAPPPPEPSFSAMNQPSLAGSALYSVLSGLAYILDWSKSSTLDSQVHSSLAEWRRKDYKRPHL